jgi:LmbE family N-acetylglucosaminyl deacetylase
VTGATATILHVSVTGSTSTILHVSPHPDDELLGAPATLFALRDRGWRVVNLACSLGRPGDARRRRTELMEACRRARFELVIPAEPAQISRDDDLAGAESVLSAEIRRNLNTTGAAAVIGPSPEDGHHGHEVVGRAIENAVAAHPSGASCAEPRPQGSPAPLHVMFWGLWRDLARPNLLVPFDGARLQEIQHALAAHAGELTRNRYDRLLEGRASAHAVLGPERVFGFGSPGIAAPYAELLRDVTWSPSRGWQPEPPRVFDPEAPLGGVNPWGSSGRSSSSR